MKYLQVMAFYLAIFHMCQAMCVVKGLKEVLFLTDILFMFRLFDSSKTLILLVFLVAFVIIVFGILVKPYQICLSIAFFVFHQIYKVPESKNDYCMTGYRSKFISFKSIGRCDKNDKICFHGKIYDGPSVK